MSHENSEMNGPEMNEIEAALAIWTPRAPQLDRDRLMFAAGRAAGPPPPSSGEGLGEGAAGVRVAVKTTRAPITRHLWPVATCLSTAAAVILAFFVWNERHDLAERSPAARDAEQPTTELVETAPIQPRDVNNPSINPPRWGGLALPSAPEGTYLALRNRMLTTPADQWPLPMSREDNIRPDDARRGSPDPAVNRQPPTSRNLLREFLPPKRPARQQPANPTESPAAQTNQPQEALT